MPVPPTTWLRLPAEMPVSSAAAASSAAMLAAMPAATEVWQLMQPVLLPGHLERDSLFVPQSAAGAWVRPLAGARWIEPLRDAVPRLLREDLVRLMGPAGGRVLWTAPVPPGLVPTRQLRVEIAAFEIGADGKALALHARWSIADARGAQAPTVHEARFETPAAGTGTGTSDIEAWALAHRQAIATLAARIAATLSAP